MKKFWKNYKQTIILLLSLIIGVIVGGILFAIDVVRWVVYLIAKKKEEK